MLFNIWVRIECRIYSWWNHTSKGKINILKILEWILFSSYHIKMRYLLLNIGLCRTRYALFSLILHNWIIYVAKVSDYCIINLSWMFHHSKTECSIYMLVIHNFHKFNFLRTCKAFQLFSEIYLLPEMLSLL